MKLKGTINERNTGNPRKRTTKKLISFTEITTMTAATTVPCTKCYQQGITYSRSEDPVETEDGGVCSFFQLKTFYLFAPSFRRLAIEEDVYTDI